MAIGGISVNAVHECGLIEPTKKKALKTSVIVMISRGGSSFVSGSVLKSHRLY